MSKLVEESWEKLDSEFDHYLVDMKPYVLKLPNKSERQRCALWIRKLCDPVSCGSGLTGRKNRNLYARLLLHMLTRGLLEGPFTQKPHTGTLKTLPTYMAIYFDDPLYGGAQETSSATLPNWVTGELDSGDQSWCLGQKERHGPVTSSPRSHRRRHTYSNEPSFHSSNGEVAKLSSAPLKGVEHRKPVMTSDDSDLEARLNSWNLGIENPRYLRENPIPLSPIYLKASLREDNPMSSSQSPGHTPGEREVDMKVKLLEAQYQEEKLKLQQKHDVEVQKILDRKNSEIEELKAMYRSKQKEQEGSIRTLEKRVQSLVRESHVIRESKEKQITELKKMSEQSVDSLKNDWEKKLHASVTQLEQEKFELQKKHTENIQDLLEDTNQRLARMEAEYTGQAQATEHTVMELEARVKQLSVEVEHSNSLRKKVAEEKAELEVQISIISSELQEANRRNSLQERDKEQLLHRHHEELSKAQAKHHGDISHFHHEHAKASDVIRELEGKTAQLRQQLQDNEHKWQKRLAEQAGQLLQEKSELQQLSDKKVGSLQAELEKERFEARKKTNKLEETLREKDEQLRQLWDRQKQQALQAEEALEQLKKQAELSSEKAYTDTRQQMEKVEADLARSKSLREKQAQEFSRQLQELRKRYEQQAVEQKLQQEQEKMQLQQQHGAEKEILVQQHQREIQRLEAETLERRRRDGQSMVTLESRVQALQEEVLQVHTQRKQQLLEMSLLREEEKQRDIRDHEAAQVRMRAETERLQLELHSSQTTLEKASSRLKQLEKEYGQKLTRSSQVIADLQVALTTAQDESRHAAALWEEERRQLSRDAAAACKTLQEKLENVQRQLYAVEKQLIGKELEAQEQITHIRQQYETKLKGLMPASLRNELEDTIASLRSQVCFLQKRAAVLQEEVDRSSR